MGVHDGIEIEIHSPSVLVIKLRGEHDATSKEALSLALTVGRAYRWILVDLADCSFLETTMMNAFIAAARGRRERDGALELVVPSGPCAVRRTLELSNVQMILPFHATRAAGLGSLDTSERLRLLPQPKHLRLSAKVGPDETPPRRTPIRARRPGFTVVRAEIADGERAPLDDPRAA